jgi:phosphoadenosine phosphosulfate reductase
VSVAAARSPLADEAARLEGASPEEIIRWALTNHERGRVVVVTGLQAEGVAVADMALRVDPAVRIATIDTGRLPEASLGYIDTLRDHFGRAIEVLLPERPAIEAFVGEHGLNPFYTSVERRLDCCHIRKVAPLERLLATVDCWLTGLRRDQSPTRATIAAVELDVTHGGVVKVNPLAGWGEAEVRAYIDERGVPLHPLYAEGYTSIGCAPCTRAVVPGEDSRAGRWWWEQGIDKECGMHRRPATPGL